MGNTPSAEGHLRRAPQKLFKPRTGTAATAGLLSPNGLRTNEDRFSNPCLHGPSSSSHFPFAPASSPTTDAVPFPPLEAGTNALDKIPPTVGPESLFDKRASMVSAQQRQERKRRSIFRSKSTSQEQTPGREGPERRNTVIATAVPPLPPLEGQGQVTVTRHNSMILGHGGEASYRGHTITEQHWHTAGSRTSWNYDLTSYEAKRLLNLVEESAGFEEASVRSENRFSVVSEVTWKSSHPAQAESTPLSRADSNLSLYTPVRRRSVIQTPGVATRQNSVTATSRTNFRHSHPPTPNLSRQASFESTGSRVLSMPPMPARLADHDTVLGLVTPSEGDYQTIGAFKLGTLRIINGSVSPIAASPEPDEKHMIKKEAEKPHEQRNSMDYFSHGRSLEPGPVTEDERTRREASLGLQIKTNLPALAVSGPGRASGITASPVTMSPPGNISPARLQPKDLALGVKDMTGDYLAVMQFTPFSLDEPTQSSPRSPQLQTTSKHTAVEDELFEEEAPLHPEYSTVEVLDLRLDPNAKPRSDQEVQVPPGPLQKSERSIARSDSGFVSNQSPTSEYSHKPLSKTDSGYSSNVSLRSLRGISKPLLPEKDLSWTAEWQQQQQQQRQQQQQQQQLVSVNSQTDPAPGDLTLANPTSFAAATPTPEDQSTASTSVPAPSREAPPPPLPPKDLHASFLPPNKRGSPAAPKLSRSFDRLHAGGMAASYGVSKKRSSLSPVNSTRATTVSQSPESIPVSPMSVTSDTSVSALSIGSGSHRPGKLQRFLSLGSSGRHRGPPTVHATHVDDKADIPSVPRYMQKQLHAHSGLFPMTTKRLALRPQLSKDTLKTILSVGSLEAHGNEGSTGPTNKSSESLGLNRRHTFTPSTLSQPMSHLTRKPVPRQVIPRKPVPIRKDDRKDDGKDGKKVPEKVSVKMGVETKKKEEVRVQTVETVDVVAGFESELSTYTAVNTSLGNNPYDAGANAIADGRDLFFSPTGRAMSMTAQLERGWNVRNKHGNSVPKSPSQETPVSPSLPSPLIPEVIPRKKFSSTPPPVSMRTRRPMSLRVPPPLRPQSTPPRAQTGSQTAVQPVSRRFSQEDMQKLRYHQSQEALQQSSGPPPPIPAMNPRRSTVLDGPTGSPSRYQHRVPDWQVKTDHGPSRRQSMDQGDMWDLQTQMSQGHGIQRPTSAQQHAGNRLSAPPLLRHRASYDGYSHQFQNHHQMQMQPNQMQIPPQHYRQVKMSTDHRVRQNYGPHPPQQYQQPSDQYGRHPPYVPRGHHRNRSMGSSSRHGVPVNVPYRILHSYNSPAYRNAPIWG